MRIARGFTLLEFVCALLVLSILGVVLSYKLLYPSSIYLDGAAKRLVSDIFLAQEIGFVSHWLSRVNFVTGGTTYDIRQGNNNTIFRTVTLPPGVSITSADLSIQFNRGGLVRVLQGGTWTYPPNVLSITLASVSESRIIDIYPYTGYVRVR